MENMSQMKVKPHKFLREKYNMKVAVSDQSGGCCVVMTTLATFIKYD